jgi:hypothetical protein
MEGCAQMVGVALGIGDREDAVVGGPEEVDGFGEGSREFGGGSRTCCASARSSASAASD